MTLGRPHVHHRRTDSTNQRAKELAGAGAPHGTAVTADEQTAGRGRQGRTWVAPPGRALLLSVVVRGLDERQALLPLSAAVAVCEACERLAPVACRIKWPNDVWIDRRKVAGILVEGQPSAGWAVVGVGLNAATRPEDLPEELRGRATSLGLDRVAPARTELLSALDERLLAPRASVLEAWRQRDALRGERVRWDGGEGVAAGISDDGALIVEKEGGRTALHAGEVHLLGPPDGAAQG